MLAVLRFLSVAVLAGRFSLVRVGYRWVAGRPLDGTARADSTWWHRGTRALTASGHTSWWALLPGWQRQAWRHGASLVLLLGAWCYQLSPVLTEAGAGAAGAGGAVLGGRRAVRSVQLRGHRRDLVAPLAATLRPALWPTVAPPSGWLTVPLDVHEEGPVRVELPGWLDADRQKLAVAIVRAKLGMEGDSLTEWHFTGRDNYLLVRRQPKPPARVGLDQALQAMLDAPASAPVIGLGRRSKVVAVDLDAESPHILISAGSGGGKSVQTRSIVAQLMRHGAQATFLDVKRQSHRWARNLPGVTYCKDIGDIHDALIALAAEGERRNRLTDLIPDDVDTTTIDVGPRIVLVAEEMNATISRLGTYWEEIREKGDPKRSPAVKALGEILFMGRAVKIHVIAIAQMMTARTLGGPEARENFATRILARYSQNAFKMLAPEIWPIPKASRHPGRVQVVIGGEAFETQALFLTDRESQEWAMAGPLTAPVTWRNTFDDRNTTPADQDATPLLDETVLSTVAPLSLADIARKEIVPLKYGTLRASKSRDLSFPAPVDKRGDRDLFAPHEIVAWYEARQATANAKDERHAHA